MDSKFYFVYDSYLSFNIKMYIRIVKYNWKDSDVIFYPSGYVTEYYWSLICPHRDSEHGFVHSDLVNYLH